MPELVLCNMPQKGPKQWLKISKAQDPEDDGNNSKDQGSTTQNQLCKICADLKLRDHFNSRLELENDVPNENRFTEEVLNHELDLDRDPKYKNLVSEELFEGVTSDDELVQGLYSDDDGSGDEKTSVLEFSDNDSESEQSVDRLHGGEFQSDDETSGDDSSVSDDSVRVYINPEELIDKVYTPGTKVRRGSKLGKKEKGGTSTYLGTLAEIVKNRESCSLCQLILRALFDDDVRLETLDSQQGHKCKLEIEADHLEIDLEGKRRSIGLLKDHSSIAEQTHSNSDADKSPVEMRIPWPQFDVQLISSWLKDCETKHGSPCTDQIPMKRYQKPIELMLIDVEKRRLVQGQSSFRFLALSYVWGRVEMLKTVQGNRGLLEEDGALASDGLFSSLIPPTIMDAMQFVSTISERYLWVDALCIIQDDVKHKHIQISQMDIIYSHAVITIVQLSGDSANTRLSGLHPNPNRTTALEVIGDLPLIWTPPDLNATLSESAYEKRGWTLQERLFSKRCVYFSNEHVYFNCRLGDRREGEIHEHICRTNYQPVDRHHLNPLASSPALLRAADYKKEWYEFFNLYSRVVDMYSRRDLSYPSDVLDAFSEVMAGLNYCFGASFISGLPEAIFDVALLWRPRGLIQRRQGSETINSKPATSFPSWCWTGWVGGSKYDFDSRTLHHGQNESARFNVLSEITSFSTINQGMVHTIERDLSIFYSRSDLEDTSSSPLLEDHKLNTVVLQFLGFAAPAEVFHFKYYNTSDKSDTFNPFPVVAAAFLDAKERIRGYIFDGEILKSEQLDSPIFEFVLLSRVSRPFEEWKSFQDIKKFKWDLVNVLMIRWDGEFAERVAIGFRHASLWDKSQPVRKWIRLG
ncbi:hypothetical protein EG329_007276 [Mollisiaceae sp. DMI_Dod_QoI]|nr:hypothetical protein EG329_007276 [Helotiales sp. DMI_Dod_QoI]